MRTATGCRNLSQPASVSTKERNSGNDLARLGTAGPDLARWSPSSPKRRAARHVRLVCSGAGAANLVEERLMLRQLGTGHGELLPRFEADSLGVFLGERITQRVDLVLGTGQRSAITRIFDRGLRGSG